MPWSTGTGALATCSAAIVASRLTAIAVVVGTAIAAFTPSAVAATQKRAASGINLDRYLPAYELSERHETRVKAPASLTYSAMRDLDLQRSGIVRAVLKSRHLITGDDDEMERRPFLEQVHAIGWGLLAEVPGRTMVFGAVAKPWESEQLHALPPAQFKSFRKPGWAKIVWTIEIDPEAQERSVFRTQTRIATTDAAAHKQFRSYWWKVNPAVSFVRQQALSMVRSDAERRARSIARAQE